ncbi:MAG: zinc-ribbon domain-containing protein [Xanthobacteraceae bacterium]
MTRSAESPMLIVCPSCASSYDVEPASLPAKGRQVRCLRCRSVWHAAPSHADKLLAAAAAIAPEYGVAEGAAVPVAEEAISQPAAEFSAEAAGEAPWSLPPADGPPEPPDDEQVAESRSFAAAADEHDPAKAADAAPADEPNGSAEVEAPPIVPADLDGGRPPIDIGADDSTEHPAKPLEDIETFAARRQRRSATRRASRWPLSLLQTGILALVLVDSILVGWRSEIVRALPQTASFYALMGLPVNLRGLAFDGIVTTTEQHEGVPILVVEGNIVNAARKVEDVPRLKFVVRNAARQEIYSWTAVPSRTLLPPGEAVAFRTRLASPPPEARDLLLRFVNRRDIIAGTR